MTWHIVWPTWRRVSRARGEDAPEAVIPKRLREHLDSALRVRERDDAAAFLQRAQKIVHVLILLVVRGSDEPLRDGSVRRERRAVAVAAFPEEYFHVVPAVPVPVPGVPVVPVVPR
eukprot:17554-Pelagococcus_subviridis.AAC.3